MIPIQLIGAVLAGAIGFSAAWAWQANSYDAKISSMQRDQATAAHKQLEQAHAETIRLQTIKDDAERLAAVRQSALARDAAASRDAVAGLRGDLAALRGSSDSISTSRHQAVSELLAECGRQYSDVAAEADKRSSEVILLLDAWPTSEPP